MRRVWACVLMCRRWRGGLRSAASPPARARARYRRRRRRRRISRRSDIGRRRAGQPVFAIEPARSIVVAEVRRAGSLARLGHDHVVASHDVHGFVAPNEGEADLYVPLDRMTVDEPPLRAEAGFDTVPTDADIAGTRRNMLTRVLDVDRFPFAQVSFRHASPTAADDVGDVAITLNGVTHLVRLPLRIESKADEIVVSGTVALKQSDYGIAPLSILGGAIQVADEVTLRFRIVARPCAPAACP